MSVRVAVAVGLAGTVGVEVTVGSGVDVNVAVAVAVRVGVGVYVGVRISRKTCAGKLQLSTEKYTRMKMRQEARSSRGSLLEALRMIT